MSGKVTIEVQPREELGTNASRRLRHAAMIPAVVYGGGRDPESVVVDPRPIDAVLATDLGTNTLVQLRIGDRELRRMVMIREVQRHPVNERLMHCDFVRVEMDQPIEVAVQLNFAGTPIGVKMEGGLVEYVHREIEVRVLPADIPDILEADISGLHIGQHLEAGEIPLPEGCELVTDPSETLCTVVGKAAEVEEAEELEEGAEEEGAEAEEAETSEDESAE